MNKSITDKALPQDTNTASLQTDKVPLGRYLNLFLSSIWVLGVMVIATTAIAYLLTKLIRPTYQVSTTVMVSKANLGIAPNYDTVWTGMNLTSTYADMITSVNVLNQVRTLTNPSISLEQLLDSITATPIQNSQLIKINVEYSDPELAVKIATNLVKALSSQIKDSQQELISAQENSSNDQLQAGASEIARLQEKLKAESLQLYNQRLDTINKSITDVRNQIEKINQEMAPLQLKAALTTSEKLTLSNDESQEANLNALITQYQIELATLTVRGPSLDSLDFESSQDAVLLDQSQRLYSSLLQDNQTLAQNTTQNMVSVTQVDQPTLPVAPIRPNLLLNLALGFVFGLILYAVYMFIANMDLGNILKSNPTKSTNG